MRIGLALTLAAVLAIPASAGATWGPARTFGAVHSGPGQPAVNARGDVALLWNSRWPARLRVTLVPAHGRVVTRVLAKHPGAWLTIVLDGRGGATAAWTVGAKLYAAHGSLTGRWTAPQLIAARNASGPVLAVSPQRRVLLAWTNVSKYGSGSTGVAWRTPGHAFSRALTLARPAPTLMPGEAPQSDVGAAFDARGRAYLWGTCDGVVRIAGAKSRKLALTAVAPGRALGFSLSVTGNGDGLASWIDSRCTSDAAAGPEPGTLHARLLRAGAFTAPLTFGTAANTTQAFALAGRAGLISGWAFANRTLWALDAQGALRSTTTIDTTRFPLAVDAGGDLLFTAPYAGVAVRPPGGSDQPFDKGYAGATAVAPNARRFAAVWAPSRTRLGVSVWRP